MSLVSVIKQIIIFLKDKYSESSTRNKSLVFQTVRDIPGYLKSFDDFKSFKTESTNTTVTDLLKMIIYKV